MTTKHIEIGKMGEDLAVRFLMKQGYKILERNYWKKWGELDIVAQKLRKIHFIEVKSVSWGRKELIVSRETHKIRPEEHVTREKILRLNRAMQSYLLERKVSQETSFQLDVITVRINLKDKIAKINCIENVL
jgi:putative endonuclease